MPSGAAAETPCAPDSGRTPILPPLMLLKLLMLLVSTSMVRPAALEVELCQDIVARVFLSNTSTANIVPV